MMFFSSFEYRLSLSFVILGKFYRLDRTGFLSLTHTLSHSKRFSITLTWESSFTRAPGALLYWAFLLLTRSGIFLLGLELDWTGAGLDRGLDMELTYNSNPFIRSSTTTNSFVFFTNPSLLTNQPNLNISLHGLLLLMQIDIFRFFTCLFFISEDTKNFNLCFFIPSSNAPFSLYISVFFAHVDFISYMYVFPLQPIILRSSIFFFPTFLPSVAFFLLCTNIMIPFPVFPFHCP